MFSLSNLITLIAAASPLFVSAAHQEPAPHRRHHEVANRARGDIEKRAFNGMRATYYAVGLGACGVVNKPSDFIVALNTPQYGGGYPGPNCFKSITISFGGKSTQATIMDQCPGCPYGGLDLSEGLFRFFSDLGAGVISIDWHFNDGSDDPPKTTKEVRTSTKPTSTWHPEPETTSTKPTSTWHPPTTTSTPPPPPTTSSKEPESTTSVPSTSLTKSASSPASSEPATTSPASSAAGSSSAAAPSSSASAGVGGSGNDDSDNGPQNLAGIAELVLGYGGMIGSAAKSS